MIDDGNGGLSEHIDIEIDGITPCLIRRVSGERYETEVERLAYSDLSLIGRETGWNGFDWRSYLNRQNHEVYKLCLLGDTTIQGAVCMDLKENWVEVHLVENAPWNIGAAVQEFRGVGAHLFAIACRRGFESGFDGFVAFQAKTNLMEYYMQSLGAERMGTNRLYIDTDRARHLVDTYFGGEHNA